MQEISTAVQEGAQAYLTRQYTIIAGVAVVLAVLLIVLRNVDTAIGFVIGGHVLRRRRVHRHEPLRARQLPSRRGGAGWRTRRRSTSPSRAAR